jgi:hypothetical protein
MQTHCTGKDNAPSATLHSRPKGARADMTPAPGDYNPEKSEKVVHDTSPKYTFGLKTQAEKPSQTPGAALCMLSFQLHILPDLHACKLLSLRLAKIMYTYT